MPCRRPWPPSRPSRRPCPSAQLEWQRSGLYRATSQQQNSSKRRQDCSQALEILRSTPVDRCFTFRAAAASCGLVTTTLFRELQGCNLRSYSNVVRPPLTEADKTARLAYCTEPVERASMQFSGMHNTVHLDEKIFYITQPRHRFLLLPDEPPPTRRIKSRRFITRVMVLSAVSRPRTRPDESLFAGKLGIWAFIEQVAAVRSRARRPAGTLETKEVYVIKVAFREKLLQRYCPLFKLGGQVVTALLRRKHGRADQVVAARLLKTAISFGTGAA